MPALKDTAKFPPPDWIRQLWVKLGHGVYVEVLAAGCIPIGSANINQREALLRSLFGRL